MKLTVTNVMNSDIRYRAVPHGGKIRISRNGAREQRLKAVSSSSRRCAVASKLTLMGQPLSHQPSICFQVAFNSRVFLRQRQKGIAIDSIFPTPIIRIGKYDKLFSKLSSQLLYCDSPFLRCSLRIK